MPNAVYPELDGAGVAAAPSPDPMPSKEAASGSDVSRKLTCKGSKLWCAMLSDSSVEWMSGMRLLVMHLPRLSALRRVPLFSDGCNHVNL